MTASHGGKGSKQRPTDRKAYEESWERIFGKRGKQERAPIYGLSLAEGGSIYCICNGTMRPGQYIEQTTAECGIPDFPGDKTCITLSVGGPGKLAPCLKCDRCGRTVA